METFWLLPPGDASEADPVEDILKQSIEPAGNLLLAIATDVAFPRKLAPLNDTTKKDPSLILQSVD